MSSSQTELYSDGVKFFNLVRRLYALFNVLDLFTWTYGRFIQVWPMSGSEKAPSWTVVPNRLTEAIIIFDGARKESKNEMYVNIYSITITFARSYSYFDHHFDVARKESKSEIYESVSTPLCLDHHFMSHLLPHTSKKVGFLVGRHDINIAKGTTDPRVEFIFPK